MLLSNLYTACKIEIAVQLYKLTSRVLLTLSNSNNSFQLASAPSQPDAGAMNESAVQLEKSSAPKSQGQLKSKLSVQ